MNARIDPPTKELLAALAQGRDPFFGALNHALLDITAIECVTYLATAPDRSVIHRVGTSDPSHFPIGGFDPIDDSAWCRRIFGDKQPIIANDSEQMRAFIPETDDLVAMGYEAIVCAPVVIAGEMRGTLNVLGGADAFTPPALAAIETLMPFVALIFTFEGIELP
ncbi:GAF domain-containing protein [Devosia algicola]|uniref:GAF domain-containing protein n=1 Tax=Devosia algicola TaxID=3026418 RepID=A0ABY7YQC7_9HYPH|nr:GAF domain-containing protein [Devosia algicola]WDR03234.1 GAF domain-containing protein [Devosia algicola]